MCGRSWNEWHIISGKQRASSMSTNHSRTDGVSNAALEFLSGSPDVLAHVCLVVVGERQKILRGWGESLVSALLSGQELSVQTSTQGSKTTHGRCFNSRVQKFVHAFANLQRGPHWPCRANTSLQSRRVQLTWPLSRAQYPRAAALQSRAIYGAAQIVIASLRGPRGGSRR